VIWNTLYREFPEATASSCDQGLDAKRNPHRGRGEVFSLDILAAARPGTSRHLADELDFVNEVKIYIEA
jgi:hypothetical protein